MDFMLERLWNSLFSKRIPTESEVTLIQEEVCHRKNSYTSVYYGIYLKHTRIGYIDLRLGVSEELYYAGNIGYRIFEKYRGHHYACYACKKVLEIAKEEYHLSFVYITCSPENEASRKTLEKLQGHLVEVAEVPQWHWLYQRGEKVKNIYFFPLQ